MINNSNQPPQLYYQNPHPHQTAAAGAYTHSTPSRAANAYNMQNSQTAAGTACGEANPSGAATHNAQSNRYMAVTAHPQIAQSILNATVNSPSDTSYVQRKSTEDDKVYEN